MDKIEVNNDLFRKRFEKISQEKNYSKVAIAAALGISKQALGNMLHKDKFNEDFHIHMQKKIRTMNFYKNILK